MKLLFQEQSFWIVVTVADRGLLCNVTPEQLHSFDTALLGFYRKAGVEIVREQLERNLVGNYPYDVRALPAWSFGRKCSSNAKLPSTYIDLIRFAQCHRRWR